RSPRYGHSVLRRRRAKAPASRATERVREPRSRFGPPPACPRLGRRVRGLRRGDDADQHDWRALAWLLLGGAGVIPAAPAYPPQAVESEEGHRGRLTGVTCALANTAQDAPELALTSPRRAFARPDEHMMYRK